jgi:hypothetical protein
MATNQSDARSGQQGVVNRLGMTWADHGAGAVKIGTELLGAGCAALVHAAVPGLFTETAGKTVARIYDHIQSRKAGAPNPENWPDYEI